MIAQVDVLAWFGDCSGGAPNDKAAAEVRDAVIDLILCAEKVARRAKSIAHNHAPGSIGEQEADALLSALDRVTPRTARRASALAAVGGSK